MSPRRRCGWCGLVMAEGSAPETTGICEPCRDRFFPEPRRRPFAVGFVRGGLRRVVVFGLALLVLGCADPLASDPAASPEAAAPTQLLPSPAPLSLAPGADTDPRWVLFWNTLTGDTRPQWSCLIDLVGVRRDGGPVRITTSAGRREEVHPAVVMERHVVPAAERIMVEQGQASVSWTCDRAGTAGR